MRVIGGDDDNVGGTAHPVGEAWCVDGRPDHEWTAARVGTDVQWWQCTRCAVLATTAELDLADVPNQWGSERTTTTQREARR